MKRLMKLHKLFPVVMIFAFIISTSTLMAQRIMPIPKRYDPPTIGKMYYTDHSSFELSGEDPGNQWIVFSDRPNNPTFTNPEGTVHSNKTMNFLETFYVIDETINHIHVVKYDPTALNKKNPFKLESTAQDYGWVPKDKMMLWKSSVVNKQGFTVKALTVNKVAVLNDRSRYVKGKDQVRLFNAPDLSPKHENNNEIRLFQFLFVFKYEKDAVLIGKSENTLPGKAETHILGWVSKDVIEIWDQRVALEPSWKTAEDRRRNNIKTTIFSTETGASNFAATGTANKNNIVWDKDPYEIRMPARWKRLPMLGWKEGDEIVRTGVASDIFSTTGGETIASEELLEWEEKYNRARSKFRNINVVFVVDGTMSVAPYFSSINNALEASANLMGNDSKNKYRLGGVVYRDYPHEKCAEGDRSLHVQELTTINRVTSFFREVEAGGFCTDQDTDKPEAMYMGLYRAARMLSPHAEETNIVVLIGDTGNRLDDKKHVPADIVSLLANANCSLLAYQVNSGEDETYQHFINQTRDIILKSSQTAGKNLRGVDVKFERSGQRTFSLNYPEGSPVLGSVTFAIKGTPMQDKELEKEIVSFIQRIDRYQEEQLAEMDAIITGLGDKSVKIDARIYAFLQERMGITNPRDLEWILDYKDNFQLYLEGFTPLEYKDTELYEYVVFVNDTELAQLMNIMKSIINSGRGGTERRELLYNVFLEILATQYGQREARRMINRMSTQDIMSLLTNLPTTSTCNWPEDVRDRRKVSEQQITELIYCVEEKHQALRKILSNPEFFFRSNDIAYYWVPADWLP